MTEIKGNKITHEIRCTMWIWIETLKSKDEGDKKKTMKKPCKRIVFKAAVEN